MSLRQIFGKGSPIRYRAREVLTSSERAEILGSQGTYY